MKSRSVTAAYAKANLPELLKLVEEGTTVTISRYNKPVADLVPSREVRPTRALLSLKGRRKEIVLDPNWADPMTDAEVEAVASGLE